MIAWRIFDERADAHESRVQKVSVLHQERSTFLGRSNLLEMSALLVNDLGDRHWRNRLTDVTAILLIVKMNLKEDVNISRTLRFVSIIEISNGAHNVEHLNGHCSNTGKIK